MNLKKQNKFFVLGLVITGAFLFLTSGEVLAKDVNIGQAGDSVRILSDDFCLGGVCRTSWLWNLNGTSAYYNSGRIGIGTSTPGAALHVNRTDGFFTLGSVTFGGSLYKDRGATSILTVDNSGNVYATSTASITSAVGLPTSATNGQTLRYNNGSWINNSVLYNNGTNVGIGTATVGAKLTLADHTTNVGGIRFRTAATAVDLWSRASAILTTAANFEATSFRAANGTVGAPAFSFLNDTNTGMYSGGTDILRFSTAGADRMTILANGNVGIGTTDPTAKLQVISSGGANTGINLTLSNASSYAPIDFYTPSGLAGQFVTTGATFSNGLYGGDQVWLTSRMTNGAIGLAASGANGYIKFATGGEASTNERMRITSSGNVGIGTTAPTQKLSIGGSATSYSIDAGNQRIGNVADPDTVKDVVTLGFLNSSLSAFAPGGASSTWALNGNNIYNTNSGNVGIGTTNPGSYKLNVVGDAQVNNMTFANPGFGVDSRLTFSKLTDAAWISVNEKSSDRTEYSFNMSDNPDQPGDLFYWKMSDWQGTGGAWIPLQFNGVNAQIAAANINAYGNYNVYGPWYSSDGVPNTIYSVKTGSINLTPKTSGYTGTTGVYWFKIDGIGSPNTFSWGRGSIGNVAVATGVPVSTSPVTIESGLTVTFSATTGGVVNDLWQFRVYSGGNMRVANGSASLPSISFTGDTNTGMYLNNADQLGFATGGANRMTVNSGGNIGIGTTAPGAALHVNNTEGFYTLGSVTFGGPLYKDRGVASILTVDNSGNVYATSTSAITTAVGLPTSATNGQTLRYNNGSWINNSVLYNNGTNVGIGTATVGAKLTLADHTTNVGGIRFRTAATAVDLWSRASAILTTAANFEATSFRAANGTVSAPAFSFLNDTNTGMYSGGTDILRFSTAGADRMTILANGNVGIGTTGPGAKLDVNNNLNQVGFNIGTALTNGASQVGRSLPALVWAYSGVATNIFGGIDMVRGSGSSGDMRFYANPSVSAVPTEVMRLSGSTGNVGIGTTNPTYKLDVNGSIRTTGTIRSSNTLFIDTEYGTNADIYIRANAQSGIAIKNGGNVGIGTTTPTQKLSIGGSATYAIDAGNQRIGNVADPDTVKDVVTLGFLNSSLSAFAPGGASSTWAINGNNIYNINSGNVGIGTTVPGNKLDVNGNFGVNGILKGYGSANGNFFEGKLGVNSLSAGSASLAVFGNAAIGISYLSSPAPTNGLIVQGNVGIGTSSPAEALHVVGNSRFNGGMTLSGNLNMSASTLIVNKITANTIDPLYTVDGVKYSTFASAIVGGVKEEYVGRIKASDFIKKGNDYEAVLDMEQIEEGSDLWVWYKVIDFNVDNVEIFLTPKGERASMYADIEAKKIIVRSDKATEAYIRLIGKRFDWHQWPTRANDQNQIGGLFVD